MSNVLWVWREKRLEKEYRVVLVVYSTERLLVSFRDSQEGLKYCC
jgi:hypothetical protein